MTTLEHGNTTDLTLGTGQPDWLLNLTELAWHWAMMDSASVRWKNSLCLPQPWEDEEEAMLRAPLMVPWLANLHHMAIDWQFTQLYGLA